MSGQWVMELDQTFETVSGEEVQILARSALEVDADNEVRVDGVLVGFISTDTLADLVEWATEDREVLRAAEYERDAREFWEQCADLGLDDQEE